MSLATRIATRWLQASYFNVNDVVLYGKYKNHRGKIVGFGQDKWGNPTIEIEPVPKGRKQNKILGLFKIWRADVKEKALANLVNQKSARRLAARYVKAHGIDVGRTVNIGSIRIHRYRDLFTVHDLTNAGKRGKKVKVLRISLGYGSGQNVGRDEWFDMLAHTLPNQDTYQGVKNYLNSLKQDNPYVTLSEIEERGIDVEPTGDEITLKTNTDLLIKASPNDFRVLNRTPLTHPETGKPMNAFQDTNYYSKGKDSAAVFFTWLQSNLSKVNNLDMNGLRSVWEQLDVKYDYH